MSLARRSRWHHGLDTAASPIQMSAILHFALEIREG